MALYREGDALLKRLILLMLLLAVALSAAACGPVSGTGDASPPPEDSQAVPAVPETEVWTRQHRSVWGSEPVTVSADFERISGAASHGMTAGQELLLLDFMDCYYQSVTRLQVIDCTDLFTDRAQSDYHRTVWRTLAEIRLRAPIDFRLQRITGDRWRIASHDSDDNPYYSADYDPVTDTDRHLPQLLACIEARESGPRELWTPPVTWDHDYDRAAALDYMLTYSAQRNPAYKAYDDLGGNCMNFGSQVLTAGGIPALPGGYRDGWFYNSERSVSLPWVNVGGFLDLAAEHTGSGLVAVVGAPYFTGQVGDIITMGVEEPRHHTTVICGLVADGEGRTVDYLLCSNTANLRNYPASAYYYTNRQLTKILGWND